MAEKVWKHEADLSEEEWDAVWERRGLEKDEVKAGVDDFYYKMTCAMRVAKANHIEEWEALRLVKRRNRCLTDKM
eukprot:487086-Alexandrium_andersonii.AAC.1